MVLKLLVSKVIQTFAIWLIGGKVPQTFVRQWQQFINPAIRLGYYPLIQLEAE